MKKKIKQVFTKYIFATGAFLMYIASILEPELCADLLSVFIEAMIQDIKYVGTTSDGNIEVEIEVRK